jgi:hypothetical protein
LVLEQDRLAGVKFRLKTRRAQERAKIRNSYCGSVNEWLTAA